MGIGGLLPADRRREMDETGTRRQRHHGHGRFRHRLVGHFDVEGRAERVIAELLRHLRPRRLIVIAPECLPQRCHPRF
jgi:hypothetical protein